MPKLLSVTTTVRNPDRVRDFLQVASQLEGKVWNLKTQEEFQILLIKNRVYGYGSTQFTNGLSEEQIIILNDYSRALTISEAEAIFHCKDYTDPPMRGRQSFNVLRKFGFVTINRMNSVVEITELGKLLLQEDYDIGTIFLKCFVKWQFPSTLSDDYQENQGYNIKPFIGTLHLINRVNELESSIGGKPKGISKNEFDLFVPTLISYDLIETYAKKIMSIRKKLAGKPQSVQTKMFNSEIETHLEEFHNTTDKKLIKKSTNNIRDYGDNTLRYFRLTSFIHLRGKGYYVDLEPLRKIEIQELLHFDNGSATSFSSSIDYEDYITDINQPVLPWEERSASVKIYELLINDVKRLQSQTGHTEFQFQDSSELSSDRLKIEINNLRKYRSKLNEILDQQLSQDVETISDYINQFDEIKVSLSGPVELERISTLCLNALDDAIRIKPNYPVGDDNNPISTAPGNCADIECYYEKFNAIYEVTLLRNRDQWFNEGQPVMRHLRDFEDKNTNKKVYCVFLAPLIHRDTLNTFWNAMKFGYEGKTQRIIPLTFSQFSVLLDVLLTRRKSESTFLHSDMLKLFDRVVRVSDNHDNSQLWFSEIENQLASWKQEMLSI